MDPTASMQPAMPRLNEPAPDFTARTTHGERSLSDYRGRWLVLFSHPADFTPVCTTEFMAFARNHDRFKALNCDLLGLSIDSTFAHIAWVRSIEKNFGVKVQFPIIEDLSMKVAQAYGMIQPGASDTSAVRATFIIDPEGMLRAMVYYPMTNGRSIDEFLRVLEALQTSDKHGVATPENWKPGDKVIVPPPQTQEAAEKREKEGYEYVDWYFSKKDVA
ncbi:peroxiredoxin [Minwuia thermotolerans]|uniref:Peroxiredoxin n=1 Tax=Minwuia thermotolerans TaxID=2056226 RepID=A0A2M9G6K9_9PROT|nr:peroxiredoxin [Minwuia thermotolerans]PJK31306.1 peroxiredoxin [Minwuia thermotolerans]